MRPIIIGITLVAERSHDKYERTIFIRDDLKVKIISVTAANYVEVITAELHRSLPPNCNRIFQ